MKRTVWQNLSPSEQEALLRRPALAADDRLRREVTDILSRVRSDGDAALFRLARQLDGVEISELLVSPTEFEEAGSSLRPDDRAAIRAAAANISAFHRAQLPEPLSVETTPGVTCERLIRPIESVGLYVPAGSAPLPSTALMLGVPASLAGCPTRVLCSPPRTDGRVDPAVLYAAGVCGISTVVRAGGAQAIAAMAYGTETVPRVDKLFGPGNAWVTEAKEQVAADPRGAARDLPAGPSEVLVIADEMADPAFVAADLLSQAEHGIDSQVILLTPGERLLDQVLAEIETQTQKLSRREIVRQSLANSRAILVRDLATAVEVSNRYAPEHLILQIEHPRRVLDQVVAAGSVFLGPWAPETVGDYCSGTNHVLPTYGFARAYSGLGVTDFLRTMTVQTLTEDGLRAIGPIAERLAALEGLDAHGQAVRKRLEALA